MRALLLLIATFVCSGAKDRCAIDVDLDRDGRKERLTVEGGGVEGALVAIGPGGKRWVLDHHVVTRECYSLQLFGRPGIMILPYGMAIRFYEASGGWGTKWNYVDLYSFYTASWQGGLLQADIDGDGRLDLFCGNYWIQSPSSFELPWRLFAINAFHEHPVSATANLHWDGKRLLWVESRRPKGRVVWFRPPEDVKQLWIAEPHPMNEKLACPQLALKDGQPVISASKRRCR
jgi:hypothetical protein